MLTIALVVEVLRAASSKFAVPITFLAIIAPMMRTPAHLAAALVASLSALSLTWVPFDLGLIIAASLGMITGAQAELMLTKRGLFK